MALTMERAREFYEKWRKHIVYNRLGSLPEWKREEAFQFAASFAREMLEEAAKITETSSFTQRSGEFEWGVRNAAQAIAAAIRALKEGEL